MIKLLITGLVLPVALGAAAPRAAAAPRERFVDPVHKMAFAIPNGAWRVEPGFGRRIARMVHRKGGRIEVAWIDKVIGDDGDEYVKAIAASQFGASRIESIDWRTIDNMRSLVASFDILNAVVPERGVLFIIPENGGTLEIVCRDDAGGFLKTYLSCRNLVAGISHVEQMCGSAYASGHGHDLPSPRLLRSLMVDMQKEPASAQAAVELAFARAAFAYLDGRAGCDGIEDEFRQVSAVAKSCGDDAGARGLMNFAHLLANKLDSNGIKGDLGFFLSAASHERAGRREVARKIYKDLSGGNGDFFSLLALARMDLEDDDPTSARRRLSKIEGDSLLAGALRIWLARLEGDIEGAKAVFEDAGDSLCGSAGALAAHQLGLALLGDESQAATGLFHQAIEADPSYTPAYISLAKAMLDRGDGPRAVFAQMHMLLKRAPQSPDISGLRERLDKLVSY